MEPRLLTKYLRNTWFLLFAHFQHSKYRWLIFIFDLPDFLLPLFRGNYQKESLGPALELSKLKEIQTFKNALWDSIFLWDPFSSSLANAPSSFLPIQALQTIRDSKMFCRTLFFVCLNFPQIYQMPPVHSCINTKNMGPALELSKLKEIQKFKNIL